MQFRTKASSNKCRTIPTRTSSDNRPMLKVTSQSLLLTNSIQTTQPTTKCWPSSTVHRFNRGNIKCMLTSIKLLTTTIIRPICSIKTSRSTTKIRYLYNSSRWICTSNRHKRDSPCWIKCLLNSQCISNLLNSKCSLLLRCNKYLCSISQQCNNHQCRRWLQDKPCNSHMCHLFLCSNRSISTSKRCHNNLSTSILSTISNSEPGLRCSTKAWQSETPQFNTFDFKHWKKN